MRFLLLVLVLALPIRAWVTYPSEPFLLHTPQEVSTGVAWQILEYAQEVYGPLSEIFGPAGDPIHLVVRANSQRPGGVASVWPQPRLEISLAYPIDPWQGVLGTPWLKSLLAHELTHVLQMDYTQGLTRFTREVLGRSPLALPGELLPLWFLEGVAIYVEGEGARGESWLWQTSLALMARYGPFPGPHELEAWPYWPYHYSPYIFGSGFVRHLVSNWGEEVLAQLTGAHASLPLAGFSYIFSKVVGQPLEGVWSEWQAQLAQTAPDLPGDPPVAGLTGWMGDPSFGPGGEILVPYLLPDTSEFWLVDSGREEAIYATFSPGLTRGSWGNQGVLTSEYDLGPDGWVSDLKLIHGRSLTKGSFLHSPAWSPGGNGIAAIGQTLDRAQVILLDASGRQARVLLEDLGTQYFSPAWAPDGQSLILVHRKLGGDQLILLGVDGQVSTVLRTPFRLSCPSFTPDGAALVFSMEVGGVSQIYALDLGTSKVLQLTQVPTGATSPALSPDGTRLAYLSLTPGGFGLWEVAVNHLTGVEVQIPQTVGMDNPPPLSGPLPQTYRLWSYLQPADWYPWVRGIQLAGADPVDQVKYRMGLDFYQGVRWTGKVTYRPLGNRLVLGLEWQTHTPQIAGEARLMLGTSLRAQQSLNLRGEWGKRQSVALAWRGMWSSIRPDGRQDLGLVTQVRRSPEGWQGEAGISWLGEWDTFMLEARSAGGVGEDLLLGGLAGIGRHRGLLDPIPVPVYSTISLGLGRRVHSHTLGQVSLMAFADTSFDGTRAYLGAGIESRWLSLPGHFAPLRVGVVWGERGFLPYLTWETWY